MHKRVKVNPLKKQACFEGKLFEGKKMVGEKEIEKLLEGNRRFVEGKVNEKFYPERRRELAMGQHPFATVLGCSDSRVDLEAIFDANLGDVFGIKTAGNIIGEIELGSIEYGVGHLETPLLVVLSHTKCGAVTATCERKKVEGNLGKIIEKINPSAERVGWDTEKAIDENAREVVKEILLKSKIVREAVEKGKTRVVIMKYDIETGRVRVME